MGYLGSNASFTGTQNNKRVSVIATQGQTLFTVSGGYAINAIDVYRNGVKLSGQRDFTALDGASVTLVSAANADDILEFVTFENFQREDVVTGDGDSVIKGNLQVNGNLDAVNGTLTATNLNVSGIYTATQFSGNITGTAATFTGNITGVAATFTGNVTVGGTLTYDDVTNIDSIGLVTARNGLQVLAGVSTFASKTRILDDVEFHVGTNGASGDYKFYRDSGNTRNVVYEDISGAEARFIGNIGGNANADFHFLKSTTSLVQFSSNSQKLFASGNAKLETNVAGVSITGMASVTAGMAFTGFLREGINIVSGKLSDNTTINIDHSMAHYFTTTETTTGIPNFTSTAGINTDLSVGETFSVNVITTAATAGYSTGARIDAGSTLSVLWNGGDDPSEGGSGGVDVYTYQVIKTGDAAFTVLGNVSNFA